jgi:hypothetical protein
VIVNHKADLPGAERVEAQVLATQALSNGPAAPVLRVSARSGAGLPELWKAITGLPLRRANGAQDDDLLQLAQATLATRFTAARQAGDGEMARLLDRWHGGEIDKPTAVAELLGHLARRPDPR